MFLVASGYIAFPLSQRHKPYRRLLHRSPHRRDKMHLLNSGLMNKPPGNLRRVISLLASRVLLTAGAMEAFSATTHADAPLWNYGEEPLPTLGHQADHTVKYVIGTMLPTRTPTPITGTVA